VVLVLQNSQDRDITLDEVRISGNNQFCANNEALFLNSNEKAIIIIQQCNNGETGRKFKGMINLTYTIEGQLSHIISGLLIARVAEGSSISSQNICQDAETNELCEGLDIVYGIGYRDACCGEFSLCC